jgi:hypothetical protein
MSRATNVRVIGDATLFDPAERAKPEQPALI